MFVISISIITTIHVFDSKAVENVTEPPTPTPQFYNLSAKEGLREALIYYGIQHPDIVYAQAVLETGHFKSQGCLRDNNLFGLYNSKSKRYHKFDHWHISVVKYKEWIQKRYKPPEDYYHFLQRIGYAQDPQYINKLKRVVRNESESSKRVSLEEGSRVTRQ